MSTLTGQQINQTYDGLLNLQDSTTGITNSFQAIQDGLGNNTGLQIKQNQLQGGGLFSSTYLVPQYMGSSVALANPAQYALGTQNIIQATEFYDNGVFSYSAMSFYLGTATSTSDTCDAAIYSSQYINGAGLHPKDLIISGITIPTTGATGMRTITFPSNISMSGTGAGPYFLVYKISNSGVQPTFRPGVKGTTYQVFMANCFYGTVLNLSSTQYATPFRTNGNNIVYSGTSTFQNPYPSSIATTQSTTATILGSSFGMLLHVVGA
jgi:hypothetical protein